MIEKGIEPPARFAGRHRAPCKYPFHEMEINDSVFYSDIAEGRRAYDAAKKIARRGNWDKNFSQQTQDGGLRIWRVA
jgi:hypothetical protein